MALCASCGVAEVAPGQSCPKCGAPADGHVAAVSLGHAAGRQQKASAPPELVLELSNDPRDYGLYSPGPAAAPRVGVASAPAAGPPYPIALAPTAPIAVLPSVPPSSSPVVVDLAADARLLADYGEPPRHWFQAPLYAWRVLRRQRELRAALVKRREEAARTTTEAEDALVAFAERAGPTAEQHAAYAAPLKELKRAEEILRSRDKVLASEQDAQNARLSQVDVRLSKLEGELAQARTEERTVAAEVAAAQAALARQEAKLKKAESELRTAQKTLVAGERPE